MLGLSMEARVAVVAQSASRACELAHTCAWRSDQPPFCGQKLYGLNGGAHQIECPFRVQNRKSSMRANVFRFAPESGHCATQSACPFRANGRNGRCDSLAGRRVNDDDEKLSESSACPDSNIVRLFAWHSSSESPITCRHGIQSFGEAAASNRAIRLLIVLIGTPVARQGSGK